MPAPEKDKNAHRNAYWPFGFPPDVLLYCKHFAEAGLRLHFPWPRSTPRPSRASTFMTLAPLHSQPIVTPDQSEDGDESELPEPGSKSLLEPSMQRVSAKRRRRVDHKRVHRKPHVYYMLDQSQAAENAESESDSVGFTSVYTSMRSAAAQDAASRLFADSPKMKMRRVESKWEQLELLPHVKTVIGGIGLATHIIRLLVGGFGSYSPCKHNCGRNSSMIVSRVFGAKRHDAIFLRYRGLSSSIPRHGALAKAMQVMQSTAFVFDVVTPQTQDVATEYLKANTEKLQSAVRTGNIFLVAAMLDSGVSADSK